MKDRFSLEQEILDCWHVTKDIDMIFEANVEQGLTQDQVSNMLLGLKELYDLKFDKMFRTFETLIKQQDIR